MEQRDWELLDKQVRGLSPPRNDVIMVLTLAAVFFAGMTLGGLLFPREGEPMQIASSDATACDYPSDWCATNHAAIAGGSEIRKGNSPLDFRKTKKQGVFVCVWLEEARSSKIRTRATAAISLVKMA